MLADLGAGLHERRTAIDRELERLRAERERICEAEELIERGFALAREVLGDGAAAAPREASQSAAVTPGQTNRRAPDRSSSAACGTPAGRPTEGGDIGAPGAG
jgi:hypothetical protein